VARPILTNRDLDNLRIALVGRGAVLTLFKVTPTAGETELTSLTRGWCPWRRYRGFGPSGSVTVIISKQSSVDVEQLRENAVMEVWSSGRTRRYAVAEITETQDLNSGWVLHGEPIKGAV
jgi:hypothetical protein